MTLYPQRMPPVPEATATAVQSAFPNGNLSVDLRTEFGALFDDRRFAHLYPVGGRPVEAAPWWLALVLVMHSIEGLSDRQATDAVRRCIDWKCALSLDLAEPGFDCTLLHDFRERLLGVVTAVAINLVRVIAWLWNDTLGDQKRPLGHFARVARHPVSRRAMIY